MKTWIVVVNRVEAKVFEYNNRNGSEVTYVTKLANPRGRLRSKEINADKPGFFSNMVSHGSRYQKAQSPTERVAQEFAIKVCDFLDDSSQQRAFDDLILIAEPQFLGRLRNTLCKEVSRKVSREIAKDLGIVTREELKERLWPAPVQTFSL
ncbi:host attachment protein [Bdellovibrio sp. 22V]|uniref:host attachment protein n=1 Tax=Bdellovibrio TaxID=958 RepID=UPI00254379BE|nr:host attachment protein [Bdellovibrio sp. 22V]WII71985.1 host attachment protein [Bdellovibrio sp. 22V]